MGSFHPKRPFLFVLQIFIILPNTSTSNQCLWNTAFNKHQETLEINNCKAQTIDKNFLSQENANKYNTILKSLTIKTVGLTTIEDFTFNTAIKLEKLDLSHNDIVQIKKKSFSGLLNLKELYLNNNRIKLLDRNLFVALPALEILFLNTNDLISFDFGTVEKNLHLKHLAMAFNNIATIKTTSTSVFELIKLDRLGLEKNKLSKFSFQDLPILPNLQNLFIDWNSLTDLEIDEFKSKFGKLKHFNFVMNPWDCCYLLEMINQLKSELPGISVNPHLPGPLDSMSNLRKISKCTKCAKPHDNLKQIKALEMKLNEHLEQKDHSFFNGNTTSLILGFLVVVQMIVINMFFILKKK